MILPFLYPLYFCTSGCHHKHYNQHRAALLLRLSAQLVDHKFLTFHQFLDCISLGFLNHCKDLYIYVSVRSIRLLVLVIYQWLCGCPKRPNQDLFCLFCRFSLAVFWFIIGQELENPYSESSDSIYPKRNRWLFSII